MKKLYLSHGDKGGVGKSMLSDCLVDYFLSQSKSVGIIEGDRAADVGDRFIDNENCAVRGVDLNRIDEKESAYFELIETIDELIENNLFIVNLPASASATLEVFAEGFIEVLAEREIDLFIFYSMGKNKQSNESAEKSFQEGLLMSVSPENRCLVFPEFLGVKKYFYWFQNKYHEKYKYKEAVFPMLKPDPFVSKLLNIEKPFSELLRKDSELNTQERTVLKSFITKYNNLFDSLL